MAPTSFPKQKRRRQKTKYARRDLSDDDDGDDPSERKPVQTCYFVLAEADVRQRQEQAVARLSDVLAIPRHRACDLLRRHKWRVSVAEDAWFAEEEQHVVAGEVEEEAQAAKLYCGMCLESCLRGDMTSASASCRHYYCRDCWRSYVSTSIAEGLSCLTLACPEPSCAVLVGQELIDELATAEEKARHARYVIQSYVQRSSTIKWCPSPGCELAVEYDGDGDDGYEVRCRCSHVFCWNCTEEVHRPVDCKTVARWSGKNMVEKQNSNWILAYTKPCPKCKRPIEKNKGCNHMTCSAPCKFQFCWFCLKKWPGDGHICNKYQETDEKSEDSKQVLDAKRYMHYYERWEANQKSRERALADLHNMRNGTIRELAERLSRPETSMQFIIDAWLQIAECRRALKWSYAYGYFIPEHEKNKLELFACLQGMAESTLERLHGCAEYELHLFIGAPPMPSPAEDFDAFRSKLLNLTTIARKHFQNLTRAMEQGLEDAAAVPEQDHVEAAAGGSSANTRSRKPKRRRANKVFGFY